MKDDEILKIEELIKQLKQDILEKEHKIAELEQLLNPDLEETDED